MVKHLGSTLAIILAVLLFLTGTNAIAYGQGDATGLTSGPMVLLGALAYRSAKKVRIGDVSAGSVRTALELVAMAVVILLWIGQNDLKSQIANHPVPSLIIPLWLIIAFFSQKLTKSK